MSPPKRSETRSAPMKRWPNCRVKHCREVWSDRAPGCPGHQPVLPQLFCRQRCMGSDRLEERVEVPNWRASRSCDRHAFPLGLNVIESDAGFALQLQHGAFQHDCAKRAPGAPAWHAIRPRCRCPVLAAWLRFCARSPRYRRPGQTAEASRLSFLAVLGIPSSIRPGLTRGRGSRSRV